MCIEYCLLTNDQILKFIFRLIDTNEDEVISKKDILVFFSQKQNCMRIFPTNYLKLIEVMEIERSDFIPRHEFMKVIKNIPFLIYPAVRLQEDLKALILGDRFWNR